MHGAACTIRDFEEHEFAKGDLQRAPWKLLVTVVLPHIGVDGDGIVTIVLDVLMSCMCASFRCVAVMGW